MVLTQMLYGDKKSFSASLDTAIRLPVAKGPGANDRQVRYRERGKLDRDANLGALLRLRRHLPKAALKLTDDQWVYLSEMYEGGMTVTEVAALHDVNKSTVSRSVNRAKKTLQDYLQFCL